MKEVEKKYLSKFASKLMDSDCDYCGFYVICRAYTKEQGVKNTLCDVVNNANDIIQGS